MLNSQQRHQSSGEGHHENDTTPHQHTAMSARGLDDPAYSHKNSKGNVMSSTNNATQQHSPLNVQIKSKEMEIPTPQNAVSGGIEVSGANTKTNETQ